MWNPLTAEYASTDILKKGVLSIIISCTGPFNQTYIHRYYIDGIKCNAMMEGQDTFQLFTQLTNLKLLVNKKKFSLMFPKLRLCLSLVPLNKNWLTHVLKNRNKHFYVPCSPIVSLFPSKGGICSPVPQK